MILKVKVKPGSREEKIKKTGENEYFVSIKEPAKSNKANIRLINLLSKELNTGYKNIKIKNPASRKKIIEIGGKG